MRWGNGGQRGREKSAVNSAIFLAAAVVLFSLIIARENVLSASMLSQSSEEQVGSDERILFWIACCILSQPIMCATASKRVVARVGLELFPFSSTYALTYKLKGPRRIETKTLISHVWGSWLEHRMSNKWYNKKVRELLLCWRLMNNTSEASYTQHESPPQSTHRPQLFSSTFLLLMDGKRHKHNLRFLSWNSNWYE